MSADEVVNVRYMVNDVAESLEFYTTHFGFQPGIVSPAFADVTRNNLRLLLSGPLSSAGRAMPDPASSACQSPTAPASSRPSPMEWLRGSVPNPIHHHRSA